jgi:hypothetical protein
MEILIRVEDYKRDTAEFLRELSQERDEDIRDYPNLLKLNWDDIKVLNKIDSSLYSVLAYNALYPNPRITKKVKASRILKPTAKWIIGLDKIQKELDRLKLLYPEMLIEVFQYFLIRFVVEKVKYSFLFVLSKQDINRDKNLMGQFNELNSLYRSMRRSPRKTTNSLKYTFDFSEAVLKGNKDGQMTKSLNKLFKDKKEPIENLINNLIRTFATPYIELMGPQKGLRTAIGLLTIESYQCMRQLPIFLLEKNGTNELYRNFYPLFFLVIKDKVLYSREQFMKNAKNAIKKSNPYDGDYNKYKISKVKTILGKTKSG